MLQSANVTLRRSSEAPLRRLRDVYGGEDGAETQLEDYVLAAERRVKGRAPALAATDATQRMWGTLTVLLHDVSAYGALGTMGGADQRFCRRVQPLLTRLTKCVLSGGFDVMTAGDGEGAEEGAGESAYDVEALLHVASEALANCSEGVARRSADTTFEVQLDSTQHLSCAENGNRGAGGTLSVCFGFADYTSGETGALLWAGAVGLSLFLIERYTTLIAERAHAVHASTGRPLRIIELGCGPALVSLVLAAMAARTSAPQLPPCRLDVTDVSATVVEEARRSFLKRNGPAVAAMVADESSDGISSSGSSSSSLTVHPFVVDFSAISPELCGVYDLVVASDVVYDHAIAAHVAPALAALLRPGGVALLCCEAHRDGMAYFTDRIRADASMLRVTAEVKDVQTVLTRLVMLSSLTASTCSLIQIEKSAV